MSSERDLARQIARPPADRALRRAEAIRQASTSAADPMRCELRLLSPSSGRRGPGALATGDAGVEEISLQHRVVQGEDRDDHGGIFGALALVDGGGVGWNQRVKFAKAVGRRRPSKLALSSPASVSTSSI